MSLKPQEAVKTEWAIDQSVHKIKECCRVAFQSVYMFLYSLNDLCDWAH